MRLAAAGLLALALLSVPACGGGGGGGGGPQPPTRPLPGITLTPAGAASPAFRLVSGPASTTTVLEVEVRADGVSDLYGLAFDLSYPSAQLRFDSFAEGNFLAGAGTNSSLQVVRDGSNRLIVGFTRLGAAAGVSGSGVLLTLRFTAIGAGLGDLVYLRNRSYTPNGTEQTGVNWAGANVNVVL
ncbi:MAG: cohesin domain-containing protein [Thermoanaerobaculia bacterium]|nr:cohesin domain-containing protein [Thermoanaerobaculia bacterium]